MTSARYFSQYIHIFCVCVCVCVCVCARVCVNNNLRERGFLARPFLRFRHVKKAQFRRVYVADRARYRQVNGNSTSRQETNFTKV